MPREQDIIHQEGDYWVLKEGRPARYTVLRDVGIYAETLEAYPDASLAIARGHYLARRPTP